MRWIRTCAHRVSDGMLAQQNELRGDRLPARKPCLIHPAQTDTAKRCEQPLKCLFGQVHIRTLPLRGRRVHAPEAVEIIILTELHALIGAALDEASQVLLDTIPRRRKIRDW